MSMWAVNQGRPLAEVTDPVSEEMQCKSAAVR